MITSLDNSSLKCSTYNGKLVRHWKLLSSPQNKLRRVNFIKGFRGTSLGNCKIYTKCYHSCLNIKNQRSRASNNPKRISSTQTFLYSRSQNLSNSLRWLHLSWTKLNSEKSLCSSLTPCLWWMKLVAVVSRCKKTPGFNRYSEYNFYYLFTSIFSDLKLNS